jgi:carboxypeptidase family protein
LKIRRTTWFATVLLVGAALDAQPNSGSVSGVVVDNLGAPMPQAEVRLTNSQSGAQLQVVTPANGEFSLAGLAPASYDIAVFVHGTRLYIRQGVAIEAGQPVKLDIHLKEDGSLGAIGDDIFERARLGRQPAPTGPAPRALDGHPDLSGVWAPMHLVEMDQPGVLPWAEAEMKRPGRVGPNAYCLPQGVLIGMANPIKLVQSPTTMVVLMEDVFTYRQFHLDGRAHPTGADPTWMGHSVGRWEGDTLVVDTVGFNDKGWMPQGRPRTEKLHLIERLRRPDAGHLEYEVIADDPGTYTKPWHLKYATNLLVGDEIGEYVCTENEQDSKHYQ